jgi:hypothetical protein
MMMRQVCHRLHFLDYACTFRTVQLRLAISVSSIVWFPEQNPLTFTIFLSLQRLCVTFVWSFSRSQFVTVERDIPCLNRFSPKSSVVRLFLFDRGVCTSGFCVYFCMLMWPMVPTFDAHLYCILLTIWLALLPILYYDCFGFCSSIHC